MRRKITPSAPRRMLAALPGGKYNDSRAVNPKRSGRNSKLTKVMRRRPSVRGGHRQSHGGPRGASGGNPLVLAVGESAVEVGLGPDRPRLYMPRSIGRLATQQIADARAIRRIVVPGDIQRIERLPAR